MQVPALVCRPIGHLDTCTLKGTNSIAHFALRLSLAKLGGSSQIGLCMELLLSCLDETAQTAFLRWQETARGTEQEEEKSPKIDHEKIEQTKSNTSIDNSNKRRKATSTSLAPSMTKGAWVQKNAHGSSTRCSSPRA